MDLVDRVKTRTGIGIVETSAGYSGSKRVFPPPFRGRIKVGVGGAGFELVPIEMADSTLTPTLSLKGRGG